MKATDRALTIEQLPSIKDKFTLKGKRAFVTGAAGGIGRSTAAAMAELGADIVIMDIAPKKEALELCAEQIAKRYGVRVLPLVGNVTDEESVGEMYDKIEEEFGGIDVVHSNAGIAPMTDNYGIDLKTWQQVMDVNINGCMLIARYGAEMMRGQGTGGSVIITASMSASIVNRYMSNDLATMAYCTSKGAIKQFTKALAIQYAQYGVRVNSISPGYVLSGIHDRFPQEYFDCTTDTVPLKRYASLDEVAGVVAMLATDLSSYMLGSDVVIDGGYTIW